MKKIITNRVVKKLVSKGKIASLANSLSLSKRTDLKIKVLEQEIDTIINLENQIKEEYLKNELPKYRRLEFTIK